MLKTIQKVKHKQLTFEELCPEWSMHLAKMKSVRGITNNINKACFTGKNQKEYNLLNRTCCIVGEAWKGKDTYGGCPDCEEFSGDDFLGFNTFRQFNKAKNEFVSHWNKDHR